MQLVRKLESGSPRRGGDRWPSRAAGFTLIEVLVALFVLAIGLLGMASLQTKSLEYNHNAHLRTQATNLAYDMIDRMRANRLLAINSSNHYEKSFDSEPSAQSCSSSCTPAELAAYDLYTWHQRALDLLPDASTEIDITSDTDGAVATVSVRFDENRGRDDNNNDYTTVQTRAAL